MSLWMAVCLGLVAWLALSLMAAGVFMLLMAGGNREVDPWAN